MVEGDVQEVSEVAAVGADKVDEQLRVDMRCDDGVVHEGRGGGREEGVFRYGGAWVDGDLEVKHLKVGAAEDDGLEVELVNADTADAESSDAAG